MQHLRRMVFYYEVSRWHVSGPRKTRTWKLTVLTHGHVCSTQPATAGRRAGPRSRGKGPACPETLPGGDATVAYSPRPPQHRSKIR